MKTTGITERPEGRDLSYGLYDLVEAASVGDTVCYRPNNTLRGFVTYVMYDTYALVNPAVAIPHDFRHQNAMGCSMVITEMELEGFRKLNGEIARLEMRTRQHAMSNVTGEIKPEDLSDLFG